MNKIIKVGELFLKTEDVKLQSFDCYNETEYEERLCIGRVTNHFLNENNKKSVCEINFMLISDLNDVLYYLCKDDHKLFNQCRFGKGGDYFTSNVLIENSKDTSKLITKNSFFYNEISRFLSHLNSLKEYINRNQVKNHDLYWKKQIESYQKNLNYLERVKIPLNDRINSYFNESTKDLFERKTNLIKKIKSNEYSDSDIIWLGNTTKQILDIYNRIKSHEESLPKLYEPAKINLNSVIRKYENFKTKGKQELKNKLKILSEFVESLNDVEIFFNQIIKDCNQDEK